MEIKTNKVCKGTRILFGDTAEKKAKLIRHFEDFAIAVGFKRITIPVLQFYEMFYQAGEENQKMMYNFKDAGNRDLCLAPEYTAVIQDLINKTDWKFRKDVKIFYTQECFRAEKPQAGRYRQFTQFGVEIINPTKDYSNFLPNLAFDMIESYFAENVNGEFADKIAEGLKVEKGVTRGLDYYNQGSGFEVSHDSLGAQRQICGGGAYEGGVGFAIGVDRVMLIQ